MMQKRQTFRKNGTQSYRSKVYTMMAGPPKQNTLESFKLIDKKGSTWLVLSNAFFVKKEVFSLEDLQDFKEKYIRATLMINHQKIELKKANDLIVKLEEENQDLLDYKKAYYSLRTAGVDLPYVKMRAVNNNNPT